jgi:hypothetical protein
VTSGAAAMLIARFLHPVPAGCRAYSSFSSFKGGGRFFNSTKPPKPVVSAAALAKKLLPGTTTAKVDLKAPTNASGQTGSSRATAVGVANSETAGRPLQEHNPSQTPARVDASSNHESHMARANGPSQPSSSSSAELVTHPVINAKDLSLQQFFALHRPLLLLADPSAILRSAPDLWTLPPSSQSPFDSDQHHSDSMASFVADADTARQMTHALTINRVGDAVEWEKTLRHLGVDKQEGARNVLEIHREWRDVMMDSTKRKKRKKMKKHK